MAFSLLYGNPLGWYAFLALIPFIIIYLRRPKPIDRTMPSLMFFIGESGLSKQQSFLQNLLRNLLFFLQLLIICALSFSIVKPYGALPMNLSNEVNIIIIDASASSQTMQAGRTRFQHEVIEAQNYLNGKVSIILAQNVPFIALEDSDPAKAMEVLASVAPKDTGTNIGDAMLLASEMLQSRQGRVVVLSDFITTAGPDVLVAERILAAQKNEVKFVNVGGNASNIGIVELVPDKYQSKVYIRNFNNNHEFVKLKVSTGASLALNWSKEMLPNSLEVVSFDTPKGITTIALEGNDDFPVDDIAYLSYPVKNRIKVLLITNVGSSYLETALRSSKDVDLSLAKPPVIPTLDFDIIIMHKVTKGYILPGFYEDALSAVKKGRALIVTAQEDLDASFGSILPVDISGIGPSTPVSVLSVNQFSRDIEFGAVSQYFIATPKPGTVVVAAAADQSPLVALQDYGSGQLIFYGIIDDKSGFKQSTSYPIFWSQLLQYLVKTGDISEYNVRTEKMVALEPQTVHKPSGDIRTSRLFFDEAGIYEVANRTIAANLINEKESFVSRAAFEEHIADAKLFVETGGEQQKLDFIPYLLALSLLLLALEIAYVKGSGDL